MDGGVLSSVSLSLNAKVGKENGREREMGGIDERETTDYVTMEMIVAGKEEDETLGKKFLSLSFVSSSLFLQSTDLSRLTTFFLPSSSVQLTPANFRDNRLNDTAFPFSSKCKTRGMGKRERERCQSSIHGIRKMKKPIAR